MGGAVMTSDDKAADLMREITRLAPLKKHRLATAMVDGSRRLSVPQATGILRVLRGCEDAIVAEPSGAVPDQPLPGLRSLRGVPAGWYATPSRTGSNDLDYWKVTIGTGEWEGCSFVRRALGGPTDKKMRTERVTNIQQRLALQAIHATGIEASQVLFASTVRRCIDCSILLTDETSRAYRRGPDCRAKRGIG